MNKKRHRIILLAFACGLLAFLGTNCEPDNGGPGPALRDIVKGWEKLSGRRRGKIIFARPPRLMILNLETGLSREVPAIVVAGGKGRTLRGKSPHPCWSADGSRFVYRYAGNIYVGDELGRRTRVGDPRMDASDETSWSWFSGQGQEWVAGPALDGSMIALDPAGRRAGLILHAGLDIRKHCEITGSGRFVVYDDGGSIYVAPCASAEKGIRVSSGQSCRPCAAPDDRVAWLGSGHSGYQIYDAARGKWLGSLAAPPGEEIYRLNWSNDPDFAAHMYGSHGNERMHVRRISDGEYLYIGNGWDPDLWLGPAR